MHQYRLPLGAKQPRTTHPILPSLSTLIPLSRSLLRLLATLHCLGLVLPRHLLYSPKARSSKNQQPRPLDAVTKKNSLNSIRFEGVKGNA
jgi:hypothetical protein